MPINNFYNNNGGMFYYTAAGSENLAVRKMDIVDNVTPSSNAVMAEVLYYLGVYFENNDYMKKSAEMVSKIAGKVSEMTSYYPQWSYMAGNFFRMAPMKLR
jgi:uncharacterized protein YyaL (SSP411 family)